MKAVLSDKIYLSGCTDEQMDYLSTELYYKIVTQAGTNQHVTVIQNFTKIGKGLCSIPSGRLDLIPSNFEIIDKRIEKHVTFPEFSFTLRPSQQDVYDRIEGTCIINAPVSWGKTFTAIAIAKKLAQKTLIITHTTMLRDQWSAEIEKTLGFTPDVIGSGKFKYGTPIVVSNVQTLVKKVLDIQNEFGTVIVDECHHTPSTTFSDILNKLKAKNKIGLSGTLVRRDQKHVIFKDYFGDIIFKPEKENSLIPRVLIIKSEFELPSAAHWALRVNQLELYNLEYRNFIISLVKNLIDKGYKPLIVGARVEFLEYCSSKVDDSIYITGTIKSLSERNALLEGLSTGSTKAIFGTLSIFAEGISQNELSCLVLATPTNNEAMLTQLIGRVIRDKPNKKQPLIVDIQLKGNTAYNQAKSRMSHYMQNGYDIKILKN